MTRRYRAHAFFPDAAAQAHAIVDPRFRSLLAAADWAALPATVRRRFSKRVHGGESTVYRGQVTQARIAGPAAGCRRRRGSSARPCRCRARPASRRLLPSPRTLPRQASTGPASTRGAAAFRRSSILRSASLVRPDLRNMSAGASARRCASPSSPTRWCSAAPLLPVFGIVRLALPDWLSPGDVTVRHRGVGGGRFVFELALEHRRWGGSIYQAGLFEETHS